MRQRDNLVPWVKGVRVGVRLLGELFQKREEVAGFRAIGVIGINGGVPNESVLVDEIASRHRDLPALCSVRLGDVDAKLEVKF